MSFSVTLPSTGLVGWRFLAQTYNRQLDTLSQSPVIKRDVDYFRAHIQHARTAHDLVSDRRLLKVALGAFGLQDDLNNKAFIRTLLESDPTDTKSLVNRISDARYKDFVKSFGFNTPFGPKTATRSFATGIINRYHVQSLEFSVGEQSIEMRLALAAKREILEIANEKASENTKWFKVLGRAPLRSFLETTFGLPKDFGKIDLDQQVRVLKSKAQSSFGVKEFRDLAKTDIQSKIIDRFHLMSQFNQGYQMSSNAIAIQLLAR